MLIPMNYKSLSTPRKLPLNKKAFKENKPNLVSKSTFRFCKKKNIIQSNKQSLQTTRYVSTLRQTTSQPPTHESLFKKQLQTSRSSNKLFESNSHIVQRNSFPNIQPLTHHYSSPSCDFSPRNRSRIMLKYNKSTPVVVNKNHVQKQKGKFMLNNINSSSSKDVHHQSDGLSKLLRKHKLYGQRCLLGMNIPKIQQAYQFSRFQLFNLHAHYKTLIQNMKTVQQIRKGFQSILYLNRIQMNSQLIDQMLIDFAQSVSFNNFIKVYGSIQNILFTQNIIQYIKQVFSSFYRQEMIPSERVLETLRDRMDEIDAIEVKKIIYDQLNCRSQNWEISVRQIMKACQENIHLCKRIFHSMQRVPVNANNNKLTNSK